MEPFNKIKDEGTLLIIFDRKIRRGDDLSFKDDTGETYLSYAVRHNYIKIAQLLIDNNAPLFFGKNSDLSVEKLALIENRNLSFPSTKKGIQDNKNKNSVAKITEILDKIKEEDLKKAGQIEPKKNVPTPPKTLLSGPEEEKKIPIPPIPKIEPTNTGKKSKAQALNEKLYGNDKKALDEVKRSVALKKNGENENLMVKGHKLIKGLKERIENGKIIFRKIYNTPDKGDN